VKRVVKSVWKEMRSMRYLCLLVALAVVAMTVSTGCTPSSHDRYRQYTYRIVCETDGIGIQDDFDATVLLTERPTHLSQWYFP
jgi:hypothetical protein